MPRFYFVDTNIILGYCNPFDRLHAIARKFFYSISNKRNIFLLISVEREFERKMRNIHTLFEMKMTRFLRHGNKPLVEDMKTRFLNAPNNKNYAFEQHIFYLFEQHKIHEITYTRMLIILTEFTNEIIQNFNSLINHWIVRPKVADYNAVLLENDFIDFRDRIGTLLHYPDNLHLALAAYLVKNRPGRHEHLFYTDDNQFMDNNLEQVINLPNLRIKKIKYQIKSRLGFNPETNSFSKRGKILKFIPDEDLT